MTILLFVFGLLFSFPSQAAMRCDTTTETIIKQAVDAEPGRLVRFLEGDKLAAFFAALVKSGYLIGSLTSVDRIYIVDAGKRVGYTSDNVWLFFIQDGCLISAIPATKSVILGLLP